MRMRRAVIVIAAVWVAVVMVGSTMVWAVISRAGREVAAVSDPNTVPGTTLHRASDAPSVHPGDTITHRPHHGHHDGGDDEQPGGDDPSSPVTSDPSSSTGTSTPGQPKPSREPSSSPAGPTPVQATWNGRPGTVTLECTGPTRTDLVVVPADGWRWEVDDPTSSSVTVKFQRVGGDSEFEVKSYCVAGQPHFRVESSGENEDVHEDHG